MLRVYSNALMVPLKSNFTLAQTLFSSNEYISIEFQVAGNTHYTRYSTPRVLEIESPK